MRKSILEDIKKQSKTKSKKLPKKNLGGVLQGAGQLGGLGMSVGGPIGAGIGGLVGGVMGLLQSRAQKNQMEKEKQFESDAVRKQQTFLNRSADRQIMSNFPTHGINQSYFAKGGVPTPQYEAEDEEVIQFNPGETPKVHDTGYLQQHSSTTATIKGKSHEQGGEDMSGGERIFSDKVFLKSKDADLINALKKTLKNL